MWEIKINEFLNCPSLFTRIFECIGETPALIPCAYLIYLIFLSFHKKTYFQENKSSLILFSLYLFTTVLFTALVVGALKPLWGRVRFNDLTPPLYENYTPFYVISQNGGRSFPSGHASMSALSYLMVDVNKKHKIFNKNYPIALFSILFTFIVSLSRLMQGAHFLTDLIFGILIALLSRLVTKKVFSSLECKSHRDL